MSYDLAGRVTSREVTTLGTGFDNAVDRLETDYDSRGHMSYARSKSTGRTILGEHSPTTAGE